MKVPIIIPTFNAEKCLPRLLESLRMQSDIVYEVFVVDSTSDDRTVDIARKFGAIVAQIPRERFNHGGTRRWATEQYKDYEYVVLITQDIVFADVFALRKLVDSFANPKVGCAYGRQIPHADANALAVHARRFNYPEKSRIKTINDTDSMGIKAAFISDSFAAYRMEALAMAGGFPREVPCCEDMYVAAKMLLKGWDIAYVSDARVFHSHSLTLWQEYKRYYLTGQFHRANGWIMEGLGRAEKEGLRFLQSELCFLWKHSPLMIPNAMLHNIIKWIGFQRGYRT